MTLLLFMLVAVLGVIVLLDMRSKDDSPDRTKTATVAGAINVCEQHVKTKLAAPASASFDADAPPRVDHDGDKYSVRGTVDSQNAFGANLRSAYFCTAAFTGDGHWQVSSEVLR